jgi:GNAT superfamily N-acetyltransferase
MQIENATISDTQEMVQVLKSSLGEGLLPKSVAYFEWKHVKNPFGQSKIILAKDEGRIVGVRVFMKWVYQNDAGQVNAVRAVDTSTLPEYQGKGIFSKLTMRAVEECKSENFSMVFNTPNPISLKGYLKMGWFSIGKMPLYIGLGSIFPSFFEKEKQEKWLQQFDIVKAINKLNSDWQINHVDGIYRTPLSKEYLVWRYAECPVAQYGAVVEPGKFGIIFRMKKTFRFTELRICDLWIEEPQYLSDALQAKKNIVRKIRPAIVTCSGMAGMNDEKKKPLGLFGPFNMGPLTTLRPLADDSLTSFKQFESWSPSLGTMELF